MKAPSLDILKECFFPFLHILMAMWFMYDICILAEIVTILGTGSSSYFISSPAAPTYTPNSA